MAHLEVKDDFINYCNGKNCDAQEKLNEILNNEMNKKEPTGPTASHQDQPEPVDNTDLNKLIELGTS